MAKSITGLIILSALMVELALWLPEIFFWLSFFCFVPLFIAAFNYRLSFKQGCLWGMLIFLPHMSNIFIITKKYGAGSCKYLLPLFLLLYFSFITGVWFCITGKICTKRAVWVRATVWGLAITFYFFALARYAFIPIGLKYGYPFVWPLLPLACKPALLFFLPFVGPTFLLLFLIFTQMIFAYAIAFRRNQVVFIGLSFLPFLAGFFIKNDTCVPQEISCCGYIKPMPCQTLADCIQNINGACTRLIKKNPHIQLIFMPESSMPFSLNQHEQWIETLCVNGLAGGRKLLVGSYFCSNEQTSNCAVFINDCRIRQSYVKTFLMPLTEQIPQSLRYIPHIQHLFLKGKKGFSSNKESIINSSSCDLFENVTSQLCICSEFFFDQYTLERETKLLTCLVNDSWFPHSFKKLLKLFARYKAQERGIGLFYISHEFGLFFTKNGQEIRLAC